jgi:hypothetical protein
MAVVSWVLARFVPCNPAQGNETRHGVFQQVSKRPLEGQP